MGFGGDTANVAIYCARGGAQVAYLTAVGDDPYSIEMREFLSGEGICCDYVLSHPGRTTGLYAISTDKQGERSFTYWRENSAARDFYAASEADAALASAATARILYLSGITLSLFDASGRARATELARSVQSAGGDVAFDGNYRKQGWSDPEIAREAFAAIASFSSIVLPTFEDEVALFGDLRPEDTIARWMNAGARIVVVKLGDDGAVLAQRGFEPRPIPCPDRRRPFDTTGAGDSFNAGFLCAMLAGSDPVECVMAGHRLAGEVIMHPGAIIPRGAKAR